MEYIKCIWYHHDEDEPETIYSEVDNKREETRKIEIYKSGKFGIAAGNISIGGTYLADVDVPRISDINKDKQFKAIEIDKNDFEEVWKKYISYIK